MMMPNGKPSDRKAFLGFTYFSTILFGILILVFFALVSIVVVTSFDVPNPALVITTIVGFVTMIMTQMLGLLKNEHEITRTRHEIRNELQTVSLKADVAAQIVKNTEAKTEENFNKMIQMKDENCLPKNRAELQELVHSIVEESVRVSSERYRNEMLSMIEKIASEVARRETHAVLNERLGPKR